MRALILLALTTPALAAPPTPVHWTLTPLTKAPTPGQKFTLTVQAHIEPGWHLYALQEPEGGPFPTEIALAASDPADLLRVDQSTPRTIPDPVFGTPTSFFVDSATFTLHLSLPRKTLTPTAPLHILLRYQSCNDKVCLPPHTDTLEAPLQQTK